MKKGKLFITFLATMMAFAGASYGAGTAKTNSDIDKPSIESMNKRMADMQKEMTQISETKDSKKKQILLEEHMKNMQTQIDMMGQMMKNTGMMGAGMGQGKMMGENQQHMMSQMGQMHGMMGQMMGQMQGHMDACPFAGDVKKK